ncbi:MAG TPA: acetyltransferase [Candidatus Aquabacterium excrementipullorum]|nr:acetyltransferase [Candidatus Aquabacterium excrementipullorum]
MPSSPVHTPFTSRPDGHPLTVSQDGPTLTVRNQAGTATVWSLESRDGGWTLSPRAPWTASVAQPTTDDARSLLTALDAIFSTQPDIATVKLPIPAAQVPTHWLASGLLHASPTGLTAHRATYWQHPLLWQSASTTPFAQRHVITDGRRHPLRPPKPMGEVYRRHIPWLGLDFSLRALRSDHDLPHLHRWMNDPVVAHFWQEQGSLDQHRAYIEKITVDPHTTALIGCFGNQPCLYVEAYWAREDRIAPFYDAQDFDRGWHVLVGEPAWRGRPFVTAWMPSVSHHLFLDDPRTQRLVIEPRADNDKMIRNLGLCGYAHLKHFDFPHKRALLGMLLRERFFDEALWHPRGPALTSSQDRH